jgi:hypothetical protein
VTEHRTCQHVAYRLTCEDVDLRLEQNGGRCEICGVPSESTYKGMLYIDHDYKYGYYAVRGLLCNACNLRLDDDTLERTEKEVRYLSDPWWLDLLKRRHAENVAAARRPQRRFVHVLGVERAAHLQA